MDNTVNDELNEELIELKKIDEIDKEKELAIEFIERLLNEIGVNAEKLFYQIIIKEKKFNFFSTL